MRHGERPCGRRQCVCAWPAWLLLVGAARVVRVRERERERLRMSPTKGAYVRVCTCASMFTVGGVGGVAGDLEPLEEGLAEGVVLLKTPRKRRVDGGKEGTRGWHSLHGVLEGIQGRWIRLCDVPAGRRRTCVVIAML